MKALVWFLLGGCVGCVGSYIFMSKKLKEYQQTQGLVGCGAVTDETESAPIDPVKTEINGIMPWPSKTINDETVVENEMLNTVDVYAYDEKITIDKPDANSIFRIIDDADNKYSVQELIDMSEDDMRHIITGRRMTSAIDVNNETVYYNGIRFDIFCDEDVNSITKDDVDWLKTDDYESSAAYKASRTYPLVSLHVCDDMTIDDIVIRIVAHGYIMHMDVTGNDPSFKRFKEYLKIAPNRCVYYISGERADELRDYPVYHTTTDILLLSDGVFVDEDDLADIPKRALDEMFDDLEPEYDCPYLINGKVRYVIIRNEAQQADYRISFLDMDFETYLNGRPINYSKYNDYL